VLNVLEVLKGNPSSTSSTLSTSSTSVSYSTVTDFARFRGWSTFAPRFTAM
jgi:hypothetical protein